MKFLITGITGFAGPHLAKLLLEENHEIHGVVRTANGRQYDLLDTLSSDELSHITFHYLDLKHYFGVEKLLNDQQFDGIYHLAAQSHPPTSFSDPILTFADNVTASVNIITALEKTDTRLMFCSTSEVYGDIGKDIGVLSEDLPLSPSNPYGSSKAAIDLYMQERMNNGFLHGFVTRAFSHTGPRRGVIFSISSDAFQIAKMKLGQQSKVLNIGNLNTERVVIDVRDCVRSYYLLMMNKESDGKVFNICGTTVHKMQYFTDLLIELAGFESDDVEQRIEPRFYRDIDIQVQIGDSTRVRELTGWVPEIDIERTLSDLLAYWERKLGNANSSG